VPADQDRAGGDRLGGRRGTARRHPTFLIADIRGYTRLTDRRGDEAGARLTQRFVELARDVVSSRSGDLIEVRGDEILAVFDSPREAVRSALCCSPSLPGREAEDWLATVMAGRPWDRVAHHEKGG